MIANVLLFYVPPEILEKSIRQSLGGENDREERRGSIPGVRRFASAFLGRYERVVSVADAKTRRDYGDVYGVRWARG